MTAELLIHGDRPRRWHGQLRKALVQAGHACGVRPVHLTQQPPLPPALRWLLLVDRTMHGAGEHALDSVPVTHSSDLHVEADVVVDLSGEIRRATAPRHLVPLFDGAPGECALWSALLDGRAPRLDLYDASQHTLIPIGLPATEAPHQLMVAADQVIARLVQGIVRAITLPIHGAREIGAVPRLVHLAPTQSLSALADILAIKAKRALRRRLGQQPQWHVAWRAAGDSALPADGAIDLTQWTILPDDGQRYYADPFAVGHAGRRYVFVEEFPYATGRGLISVVEIGADGRELGPPRPVLEAPSHLSYPQIFVDDGVTYMLPEAAASGRLTLYRADRFPEGWVAVGDLLDERVHDATLIKTAQGYWLFATCDRDGGSSWDALHLYRAPALLGPWSAHDRNPVLIDAGAARPAGAMFLHGGALMRPVQDCRAGYGAGLGIARIDRLDGTAFAQTVVRSVRPPAEGGCTGIHTWNRGAGLDVMDIFGPRRVGQR